MKYYAIYDLEDNIITVFENYKELSIWFEKPIESMQCAVCRFLKGKINYIKNNENHKKYKVYKIIEK